MVTHRLDDWLRGVPYGSRKSSTGMGSSNLAAVTHIEVDVIVSNLRDAGNLDIATLQGDFDWLESKQDRFPRLLSGRNGRVLHCRPILSRHTRAWVTIQFCRPIVFRLRTLGCLCKPTRRFFPVVANGLTLVRVQSCRLGLGICAQQSRQWVGKILARRLRRPQRRRIWQTLVTSQSRLDPSSEDVASS